jgi:hypothetical protein
MCQYVIKDGRGKSLQSRPRFPSYTDVAQEMMEIGATLPLTVWRHDTLHGTQSYDSVRTRKLSDGVRIQQLLKKESTS